MRIGILGATGPAGRGLAARLADVGHDVIAGSRERAKAEAVVADLRERWGDRVASLRPGDNAEACDAEVVVVAVTVLPRTVTTVRQEVAVVRRGVENWLSTTTRW